MLARGIAARPYPGASTRKRRSLTFSFSFSVLLGSSNVIFFTEFRRVVLFALILLLLRSRFVLPYSTASIILVSSYLRVASSSRRSLSGF